MLPLATELVKNWKKKKFWSEKHSILFRLDVIEKNGGNSTKILYFRVLFKKVIKKTDRPTQLLRNFPLSVTQQFSPTGLMLVPLINQQKVASNLRSLFFLKQSKLGSITKIVLLKYIVDNISIWHRYNISLIYSHRVTFGKTRCHQEQDKYVSIISENNQFQIIFSKL